MVPIVFLFNKKNTSDFGHLLLEERMPICIEVCLDFIALVAKEDDQSIINIIVETIIHEHLHELFHDEGIPVGCHHYMIQKLNMDYIIQSFMSLKEDYKEKIEERKETISRDICNMYV